MMRSPGCRWPGRKFCAPAHLRREYYRTIGAGAFIGSDTQLVAPRELTISQNGTIWVTDPQYMRAFGFAPSGKLVRPMGDQAKVFAQSRGVLCIEIDLDELRAGAPLDLRLF